MDINNDEALIKLAFHVSMDSTCLKRKVGAVLVKDGEVCVAATNGAPKRTRTCKDLGCLRNLYKIKSGENYEYCRAVHAEQNLIIQCAIKGLKASGSVIYCTHSPCIICAKMLVNLKIKRLIYAQEYTEIQYKELFKEAGIEYIQIGELSD